jgi:hypothetical protein
LAKLTTSVVAESLLDGIAVDGVAPGIVPTNFSAALVADKELVCACVFAVLRLLWGCASALCVLQRCLLHCLVEAVWGQTASP